jgi:hypothetical protein
MRITASYLRGLLKTVCDIGDWPESGPGSLTIDGTFGRYQLSMVTEGTATITISGTLKPSEMEEFLRGMIAAHDVARLRAHWRVPTRRPRLADRVTLAAVETTPGETPAPPALTDPWVGCYAAKDGECHWASCPQLRDGEPAATGRHCPLDRAGDDAP